MRGLAFNVSSWLIFGGTPRRAEFYAVNGPLQTAVRQNFIDAVPGKMEFALTPFPRSLDFSRGGLLGTIFRLVIPTILRLQQGDHRRREDLAAIGTYFVLTKSLGNLRHEREMWELVTVEIGAEDCMAPACRIDATAQYRDSRCTILMAGQPIPISAPVVVRAKDLWSLGHVLRCDSDPGAIWTVHIQINRNHMPGHLPPGWVKLIS